MKSFITQKGPIHIKKLVHLAFLLLLVISPVACNDSKQQSTKIYDPKDKFAEIRTVKLSVPTGKMIETTLAITQQEQNKGLSGILSGQFGHYQGMLFFYPFLGRRQFWMPDTYFNLDIIFLDKNLRVLAIERNVPHHPGRKEPPTIYRTKTYLARHVLEIRADSPLSKEIHVGTQLGWESKISLLETESRIHQLR